jgi:glycosyltransferase involved in cell wall biosynthesis
MIKNNHPIFQTNNNVFGGTEFILDYFHNNLLHLLPKLQSYNCIVLPGKTYKEFDEYINDEAQIILWLHNTIDQYTEDIYNFLKNKKAVDKIKYIIVPSLFLKMDVINHTGIDQNKVMVIHYGVNPVKNSIERFNNVDRVKIIHTSNPVRGMDILIKSLKYIDKDFELNIFNTFNPNLQIYNYINSKMFNDERLFFHSYTPRKTVLNELSKSHIFAYPTIYKETFCLSQAEAISANCLMVYHDFAALQEVSSGVGINYKAPFDDEDHAILFAEKLTYAIDLIKSGGFDPKDQSLNVNEKFSFAQFQKSWLDLHKYL